MLLANPHRLATQRVAGQHYLKAQLPEGYERWTDNVDANLAPNLSAYALSAHLARRQQVGRWYWPEKPVHFISDAHADARAFVESLASAGLVTITGPKARHFQITDSGRNDRVVIGGDCLDKGPSNLKLLDAIAAFRAQGANVVLLAGNHDLRLPLGLNCIAGNTTVFTEHLFVRMGAKTLPLMEEIWRKRLKKRREPMAEIPDKQTCLARLLPRANWAERFRAAAQGTMPEQALNREIDRIAEKVDQFRNDCKQVGLSPRKVYAAAREAYRLFMTDGGEYRWFLQELQLAWREGSFLFVHAGIDDDTAAKLVATGTEGLNRNFTEAFADNPFGFYTSSLGNCLRTKYRPVDYTLTRRGAALLHRIGINTVVHGHQSRDRGQCLALHAGLLHLECDVTLDRNSRKKSQLNGRGAGITSIRPDGRILGRSADYPRVKVLQPERESAYTHL